MREKSGFSAKLQKSPISHQRFEIVGQQTLVSRDDLVCTLSFKGYGNAGITDQFPQTILPVIRQKTEGFFLMQDKSIEISSRI